MRAETVHVTDHALLRWKERASDTGEAKVQEIVQAVKDSRVIKKNEPLPYPMPRVDGSVYSFNGDEGLLFILESVTIDEYRLVTVINGGPTYRGLARPPKKKIINKRKQKYVDTEKTEIDLPQFDSAIEERNWLTGEKRRLERELAETSKKSAKRKELLKVCGEIESRLTENKSKFVKEQDDKHEEKKGCCCELLIVQLLKEVRELRTLVEASHGNPGSPSNRATVGPVYVQPSVAGLSDLASQGDGPLQSAPQQDEAA